MLACRMSDARDTVDETETSDAPTDPTPRHEDHAGGHRAAVLALVLVFLLVAAGVVVAVRRYTWCRGSDGAGSAVTFEVPEGATGDEVAGQLAEAGVTRCGGVVGKLLMQQSGRGSEIRAGTYDLTTGMTLAAALDVLTVAPVAAPTVDVTIPEGYRITQIADRVESDLGLPAKRFSDLALSGGLSLPPYLPKGTPTAEGFLFPKTYEFVKADLTPSLVADRMLEQFETEARDLDLIAGAKALGYTPYEIVTIASMIEKEAGVERDRDKIAAVIYNRLDAGMTLGIDATLLYDDPTPDGQLSSSDLKVDSPYNTYLHNGLPPTPIASPGAASLEGALAPAKGNWLYYVVIDSQGHHAFTASYDEFLRLKQKYQG